MNELLTVMTTKTQETTYCLNSKLNFSWIDKEKK